MNIRSLKLVLSRFRDILPTILPTQKSKIRSRYHSEYSKDLGIQLLHKARPHGILFQIDQTGIISSTLVINILKLYKS